MAFQFSVTQDTELEPGGPFLAFLASWVLPSRELEGCVCSWAFMLTTVCMHPFLVRMGQK